MSYLFNKVNLGVIVIIIVIFALSLNELNDLVRKMKLNDRAAFTLWAYAKQNTFHSREECQQETKTICSYTTCDYATAGATFGDTCGKNFVAGWKSSTVTIPPFYQTLTSIRLTIASQQGQSSLELDTQTRALVYRSERPPLPPETKTMATGDQTLLINKMVLYDFARLHRQISPTTTPHAIEKNYSIILIGVGDTSASNEKQITVECATSACPRDFVDIKNDFVRLWGRAIPIETTSP